jgi:hypothetical protein
MTMSDDLTFTPAEVRKAATECGDVPPLAADVAKAWKSAGN